MYIEQAILTELLSKAPISALVAERIYYVTAPQDVVTPYIVLYKSSVRRPDVMPGNSHLAFGVFQFYIVADSYSLCKDIAIQVQYYLHNKTGFIGSVPYEPTAGHYHADATTSAVTLVDAELTSTVNDYYVGWYIYNTTRSLNGRITVYIASIHTCNCDSIALQAVGDEYYLVNQALITSSAYTAESDGYDMATNTYQKVLEFQISYQE